MADKNSILEWLGTHRQSRETISQEAVRLMKSKKEANAFIKTVIKNPRDNRSACHKIMSAFQNPKQCQEWQLTYHQRFSDFLNQLFQKATKIEDLLHIIPNFSPWTLEQKFNTITIGSVPEIFGTEDDFLSLVSKIHKSTVVKVFKRIKKLECSLPEFKQAYPSVKKINWFDFAKRSDFLRALMKRECGHPFTIKQGGKTYHLTFLCNPFSRKMVFQVNIDTQTFILKMSPYRFLKTPNDRIRKEHENMAISADSTYSDAVLEFYLKLNRCVNAPNILYYHYHHEAALYQADSGKPLSELAKGDLPNFYDFNHKILSDSCRLGVYVNDINAGNFLLSDTDNQVKIIDIGHAGFVNPLTPGVPGLTFTLGNLCGQDMISINGVLKMEDDHNG